MCQIFDGYLFVWPRKSSCYSYYKYIFPRSLSHLRLLIFTVTRKYSMEGKRSTGEVGFEIWPSAGYLCTTIFLLTIQHGDPQHLTYYCLLLKILASVWFCFLVQIQRIIIFGDRVWRMRCLLWPISSGLDINIGSSVQFGKFFFLSKIGGVLVIRWCSCLCHLWRRQFVDCICSEGFPQHLYCNLNYWFGVWSKK